MKTWTVKQMLAEKPCEQYTEEVLTKLWAGRKKVSWLDIEKMDIPDADKMWGARRGLTKGQTDLVLKIIVARAVTNHALKCRIPAVETWAENWLNGTDRTEAAARAAAEAAARAAEAAAWAARDARDAAAWAAGAAAELKLQLADIVAVITAQEGV